MVVLLAIFFVSHRWDNHRTIHRWARKLPQAARGDLASLKKAVSDTGAACKACHDEYRAK